MNSSIAPRLQLTGITKRFPGVLANDSVSFSVLPGEIHALLGENGAGKSTLVKMIYGIMQPDAGEIRLQGRSIVGLQPRQVWRRGVGRTFQVAATFGSMTVVENVQMSLISHASQLYRLWRPAASLHRARALELLEAVGLQEFAGVAAVELSYGRKRALEIATTLALEPEMLLLDEPMAGMGHEDVGRIAALIRRVAADRTVLMVEHNLSVVADLSDTITVLARGEVLAEGDYATVSRDEKVVQAYLGMAHG